MRVNTPNFLFASKLNVNSVLKYNRLSFKSNKTENDTFDYSYCFEENNRFLVRAKSAGIDVASDIKENIIPENLLGKGAHSEVYKFNSPELDDYVIKIDSRRFDSNSEDNFLVMKRDEFPNQNFGQAVVGIGCYCSILKKVKGETHCPYWSDYINARATISKKDAREFAKKIKQIANFPIESYVDYAKSQAILTKNGYKQDSMNPNNLIIDYKNKKINIIDYYKMRGAPYFNTSYDLSNAILAFSVFPQFCEKLDVFSRKSFLCNANKIVEKCHQASKVVGVSTDENVYIKYLESVDRAFRDEPPDKNGKYCFRYNNVKELLNSVVR